MDELERRIRELETEMAGLRDSRPAAATALQPAPPVRRASEPARAPQEATAILVPRPASSPPPNPPARPRRTEPRPSLTLEDVLSPRNLAVAGGIAVFVGLAFLVSLGISNGWISETVRVIAAAIFSFALIGGGLFIEERKAKSEPAQALVVVGAAGLFVALVAATRLYSLIDPSLGLVFAGLIGAFGVLVAMRWQAEAVAASIIGAALLSPLMIDVTYSVGLLAFLIPVFLVAVTAAVLRPWAVAYFVAASLFLVSLIACVFDADGGSTFGAYGLATLTLFLCAAGAVGHLFLKREQAESFQPVLYAVFVSAATILGLFLVTGSGTPLNECLIAGDGLNSCDSDLNNWAAAWLLTAAAVGGVVWWAAHLYERKTLAVTAFALASASIAAALGFLFQDGPLLSAAWSVQAAILIAFGRTDWQRSVGYAVLSLAFIVVSLEVPYELLTTGSDELLRDLAVTGPLLVPTGLMLWKLKDEAEGVGGALLAAVGAFMGMLTVGALISPESVVNLIPIAIAGSVPIALAPERDWAKLVFAFFGVAALFFALLTSMPIDSLVNGVPSAFDAMVTFVILAAMLITVQLFGPESWRQPALWSVLGLGLYALSVLIVDGFQGTDETGGGLPGTAQGQAIVSSLWALCGLALIVAGLRRSRPSWRKAGLVLLILAMAKITLYDLSSLSSAGRTISFILVGLVLLAAAFAYQWVSRRERDAF